ncbi:MAG: hypothetical protein R6V14_01505 [Halanaerobiales bacterium]
MDKKFDGVYLRDGMEGGGKSEGAFQDALILNPNFSEKDIVYSVEQFNHWLKTAKRGDVCVWDEFVLAGLSTDALTEVQKTLIKKFTILRSRGLIVCLVIPYMFMLRKYFVVARTRFLIHTETKGKERGFFKLYNYGQKHFLYNYGYKTWIYNKKVIPGVTGRFKVWSHLFLDHDKIEAKKQEALESLDIKDNKKDLIPTKKQIEALLNVSGHFSQILGHNSSEYRNLMFYVDKLKKNGLKGEKAPNIIINEE